MPEVLEAFSDPAVWGGLVLLALIFTFIAAGWWIGVGLGLAGLVGLAILLGGRDAMLAPISFNILNSYSLAALPLFVFMGNVIFYSGLSERLYRGVSSWVGALPGGLIHSNIITCSIMAAFSGSSVATAATMGVVAYPEQVERRGYNRRLVLGSLAAGGTLGILIPPSIAMIIYGSFVGESIGRLFMGGVVPGIVTALLFMVYIGSVAVAKPDVGPPRERVSLAYLARAIKAFSDVWPAFLLVVFVMGSIYAGLATPTEAAAVASVVALGLAALNRRLSWTLIRQAALGTIKITGMIALLLVGAYVLGTSVALLKIPAAFSALVLGARLDPMLVWLAVVVLYLVLGFFMEGITLMLLTLPITYPMLVTTLGFDGIWFGVMLTMLIECALITPPVGMILYVLQGATRQRDMKDVMWGAMPFFGVLLISITIFTLFPEWVLALPNAMFDAPRQ